MLRSAIIHVKICFYWQLFSLQWLQSTECSEKSITSNLPNKTCFESDFPWCVFTDIAEIRRNAFEIWLKIGRKILWQFHERLVPWAVLIWSFSQIYLIRFQFWKQDLKSFLWKNFCLHKQKYAKNLRKMLKKTCFLQ